MKRKIIKIHEDKCVGCGLCVNACHESALQLVDGKAKLVSDEYCDGLGNCLPSCPTDAIELIERDAKEYNEEAVENRKERLTMDNKKSNDKKKDTLACGCPGHEEKTFERNKEDNPFKMNEVKKETKVKPSSDSKLQQWPVQMKLINPNASYLQDADLLIAADCTAYAYGNFHNEFIKDKITIIACPKLDDNDYNTNKLKEIISNNNIESITVVRMEVPCCSGIISAAKKALLDTETIVNYKEVTISTDGKIID
ncbi:MAG: ATP-binding protein [Bacillota bacterium]